MYIACALPASAARRNQTRAASGSSGARNVASRSIAWASPASAAAS